jgi:hypothetical protein
MTASTVDASPGEQIARYGARLGELGRHREVLAAELAEVQAARRANLLAAADDAADPAVFRARVDELGTALAHVDEEIADLAGVRDALVAQVRAQESAERLAAEHAAALVRVDQVAREGADWVARTVAAFLGPVALMDAGTLLAVAGEATGLLARESAAGVELSTVLGKLDRYSSPPVSTLLDQVTSRLPVQPPRRQLFNVARSGSKANTMRKIADLLDIRGA